MPQPSPGWFFLGAGLAMLWFSGQQSVDLVCERSTQSCTYTAVAMGQTQQETFALDDIDQAELQRATLTRPTSAHKPNRDQEHPIAVLHVDGIDQEIGLSPPSPAGSTSNNVWLSR